MMACAATHIWLAAWAGCAAGIVLGAFIASIFSIDRDK